MSIKNFDGEELSAKDVIAAMRGGIPDECDFCGSETPPERMTPEEAGMWACLDCWNRWEQMEGGDDGE